MSARAALRAAWSALWTFGFAVLLTAATSGIWSGLFVANLRTTPAVPWGSAAMALFLVTLFTFLHGSWGGRRTRQTRRALLRARSVSVAVFAWALLAGLLGVVALSGLWIVLFQLVKMPGNSSNFSGVPEVTLVCSLVMAALSGAITEEAGFRGYFQGTLERYISAPAAIALAALAMIPEHASTQGFVWSTIVFYLIFDVTMGTIAFLARSILPGIVIHFIGLMVFFGLIWPNDRARVPVALHGAGPWFWIHLSQAIVFALLSFGALLQLARIRLQSEAV